MIGAPPPLPGREPVKVKRTTPLVFKGSKKKAAKKEVKGEAKVKANPENKPVTKDPKTADLPLIAQYVHLGQWLVIRPKPTNKGYTCLCVCGKTALLTKEQLLERRVCNHSGSDQPFKANRRAAQEFRQLTRLGLIPLEYINFNEFLKARDGVKPGNYLQLIADGLKWCPDNLLELTGAQKKLGEHFKCISLSTGDSVLQAIIKTGVKLKNASIYEKTHGTPALLQYLETKLKKAQHEKD